jgi:hypothetical protein
MADKDAISLSAVTFRAQLGSLGAQAVAKVSDKTGHLDELRTLIGCDSLGQWLTLQSYAASGACDGTCVQAACDRAIARLVGAAQTALTALDDTRPTVTVQGELTLKDADGDLVPETLAIDMLSGQWDPASSSAQGDMLTGAANATATTIP